MTERFNRQEASESDFADDGSHPGQINRRRFLAIPDVFLDLPGTRVRQELFDFFIGVALAQTSDVQNDTEPVGIDGLYDSDGLLRGLQKVVVVLQSDNDAALLSVIGALL